MSELVNETYGPFFVDPKEGCTVSINIGIGVGIGFPNTPPSGGVTPPLDEVGGAEVAFSLRKLRAAYSGSAIRVRESGGNTEADIGFDSGGDLDTAALLSHCGSNSGYVVTWYDQSGNGQNATQSTTSLQPRIVNAGSVETLNGKPAVRHVTATGGTPERLRATWASPSAAVEFVVGQGRTDGKAILSHSGDNTVAEYHTAADSGSTSTTLASLAGTPAWRKNGASQAPANRGDLYTLYAGNHHIATVTGLNFSSWSGYETAYSSTGSSQWAGWEYQQERVVYGSALSAGDIDTVEANMASYYEITLS